MSESKATKGISFIKNWMLPIAIVLGISAYLILHWLPGNADTAYISVARRLQPTLLSIMLFLQLNTVAPGDLRFHKWHFICLGLQAILFAALAAVCIRTPEGNARILLESAMLCFICPTAAAAGVITAKIGGSVSGIMTYTVLIDFLVAIVIPASIPLVHPETDINFLPAFWAIIRKVCAILVLPCLLAWLIRYCLPGLQKWLAKYVGWAFYIWGIGLVLAMSLATKGLADSRIAWWVAVLIGAISLASCIFQFWLGRRIARRYGNSERITAGQALGQKNTGFIIWLGFTYMTPVSSVAGGLYAIWHNLVNSWELYQARKGSL